MKSRKKPVSLLLAAAIIFTSAADGLSALAAGFTAASEEAVVTVDTPQDADSWLAEDELAESAEAFETEPMLACGMRHSLSLEKDGTVRAWGNNADGQLGIPEVEVSYRPVTVSGLSDVVAVSTGYSHSLALESDGKIWVWGSNGYGKLGNGSDKNSSVPIEIGSLSNIIAISAGRDFSLALRDDGTVWAWGVNEHGQLGDRTSGYSESKSTPVMVSGLSGVTAIAAGDSHSLALKSDGTVWAWGKNDNGQLGNGTSINSSVPVEAKDLYNISAVAAGGNRSLALKSDGTVAAWGSYILGIDENSSVAGKRNVPAEVEGLSNVTAVSCGAVHSIALINDGTVISWGSGLYGQLGNGKNENSLEPVEVSGLSNIHAVFAGEGHSFAVKSDGSVWAWGANEYGQLGNDSIADENIPVRVPDENYTGNPTDFETKTMLADGGGYTLALKKNGTVWAWGQNSDGQLGNGTVKSSPFPVKVLALSDVISVSAGISHSAALKSDGTVWSWGQGIYGQRGDGEMMRTTVPVKTKDLSDITAISAGLNFTLALKSDGTVWAWGENRYGQLGDGKGKYDARSLTPVQVSDLSNVTAIAAGYNHAVAVKSDGTVWAWGRNNGGQIGNGKIEPYETEKTPAKVSGMSDAVTVAGGGSTSYVLKSDGTVWAWGYNDHGQLGNGTTVNSTVPIKTSGMSDVIDLAAGGEHCFALKSDGTVWVWGNNEYGQFGNGKHGREENNPTPSQINSMTDVISCPDGDSSGLAIKKDGTVWTWGSNSGGQLGDGTTVHRYIPGMVRDEDSFAFLMWPREDGSKVPVPTPEPAPTPTPEPTPTPAPGETPKPSETPDPGETPTPTPAPTFTDVPKSAWFYDAVSKAAQKGYMVGTANGIFEPSTLMTRAMFVQLLANYSEGYDDKDYKGASKFTDVKTGDWYSAAVVWATENGIVAGTSDTTFSPNVWLNRETMVTMLFNYAKATGNDIGYNTGKFNTFVDRGDVSSWAKEPVTWAVDKGIIAGIVDVILYPSGGATRAQVAQTIINGESILSKNNIVLD